MHGWMGWKSTRRRSSDCAGVDEPTNKQQGNVHRERNAKNPCFGSRIAICMLSKMRSKGREKKGGRGEGLSRGWKEGAEKSLFP